MIRTGLTVHAILEQRFEEGGEVLCRYLRETVPSKDTFKYKFNKTRAHVECSGKDKKNSELQLEGPRMRPAGNEISDLAEG